jgi:hypothetical protein
MSRFNGVELTADAMQKAREQFAANSEACIAEVKSGDVKVNDPESYFVWMQQLAADALAGRSDHTLTFLQRAYFIQTGECVALLP